MPFTCFDVAAAEIISAAAPVAHEAFLWIDQDFPTGVCSA